MPRAFHRWFRTEQHVREEIDEEIRAHLEARIDHLVAGGMRVEEARDEALRRFGDLAAARAALLAQARTGRRRLEMRERLEQVGQDVRYVVRTLVRAPAFTLGVVSTFALGLGINAAVFRVADPVLFRPPAGVSDARALRRVEALVTFGSAAPQLSTAFSYSDARALVDSGGFRSAATYSPPRLQRGADGLEIAVSAIDAGYFPLLGVRPVEGRTFDAREAEPGSAESVAIVSYEYWRTRLGGTPLHDRSLITIGERRFTVVGVAPDGFAGIDLEPVDVWLPLGDAEFGRGTVNGIVIPWHQNELRRSLRVVGRPVAASTDEQLADRLGRALAARDRDAGRPPRTARLQPIVPAGDPARHRDGAQLLSRLAGIGGVVLLIACANAVNLLLARGVRRQREIGIRVAVGATRARIARLLLIESVMLALAGGAAALIAGGWTGRALRQLVFPDARWVATSYDDRTIIFTAALALSAGLASGLLPALRASGSDPIRAVQGQRSRPVHSTRRSRATLIVVQTALSAALLITAGLLVQSLMRLNQLHLGFTPDDLVTVSLAGRSPDVIEQAVSDLQARLREVPGVREIALASIAPFGARAMADITVPGAAFVPESDGDSPYISAVSHNYFTALETRVLRGRAFEATDVRGADPVAVVNESMARRYWGGGSPFSSCILSPGRPCARVVGIVEDVRESPAGGPGPMRFYLALDQDTAPASTLVVRATPRNGKAVAGLVRSLVSPVGRVTIELTADRVSRGVRPWRTATLLFVLLGAMALALSCVGLYSVLSYLVSERLHEFGVRFALGASSGGVVLLILREGARLVMAGALAGVFVAGGAGQFLGAFLFQVSPFEPAIYVASLMVLALTAGAAMLPPALRAGRVDPVEALRSE